MTSYVVSSYIFCQGIDFRIREMLKYLVALLKARLSSLKSVFLGDVRRRPFCSRTEYYSGLIQCDLYSDCRYSFKVELRPNPGCGLCIGLRQFYAWLQDS